MRGALVLAAVLAIGWGALGGEASLSGSLGLDADFLFDGVAWDFTGGVTLSLGFAWAEVVSRTGFSFTGFESERLSFIFDFDRAFTVRNTLVFDPCFSQYELELHGYMFSGGSGDCCPGGFDWGLIFLYGNIADVCQTPEYTLGFILESGIQWRLDCCATFEMRNYMSFGATGIYSLVDGDPRTWVSLVAGTLFEEDLLMLSLTSPRFDGRTLIFFDSSGFQWVRFEAEMLLADVFVLGGRLTFVSPFVFSTGDLIMGLELGGFSMRSITTFDAFGFFSEELRFELAGENIKGFLWVYFDVLGVVDVFTGVEVSW